MMKQDQSFNMNHPEPKCPNHLTREIASLTSLTNKHVASTTLVPVAIQSI